MDHGLRRRAQGQAAERAVSVGRERDEVDVFVLGHGQDALCGVSAFNADPGRDSASNQRVALALELAASVVFAGLRG